MRDDKLNGAYKKIGLVLGGGGGKGAYQVGAIKAMREVGLVPHFSAYSGTSVGALNIMLLLQKNPLLADYLWLSAIEDSVINLNSNEVKKVVSGFSAEIKKDFFSVPKTFWQGFKKKGFWTLLTPDSIGDNGMFSSQGLNLLLEEWLEVDEPLQTQDKPIYVTVTQEDSITAEYLLLNGQPREYIINALLATSAIPAIFGKQQVASQFYYDGGMADNLPIKPLYEAGCDLIISVPCLHSDRIKKADYPNARIIELVPETGLGGPLGFFDFSKKSAHKFMQLGYQENIALLHSVMRTMFS